VPDAAGEPLPNLPPELALQGKYRIKRELGRGGMGVVYQAQHTVMERSVALKVINPSVLDNPEALARFHGEVKAAGRLDHPNIARAYDADQAGDLHFLVMEFVEGVNLAQVLEQKGPLPIPHACHYVRQAALGLQHAFEQGMVHRDVKPQNLMLTPKGLVKVLDFGLARMRRERNRGRGLTQLDSFMGTPEYVAPEQAADARSADVRSDVYSLGCTLYFLLTGRPPFVEDTAVKLVLAHLEKVPKPLHEVRPDVPRELSALVARMLAKDPAQRFQTPVEVAQALLSFTKPGVKPALERILPKMMARNPAERYPTPGEVAKSLETHTRKRQTRSELATIQDRPVVPLVEHQPASVAISEEALPAQTIIRSSGTDRLATRRGLWIGALIGTAVFGFSCLGLGTLIFMSSGGKRATFDLAVRGEASQESDEKKDNGEIAKDIKPATKSAGDSRPCGGCERGAPFDGPYDVKRQCRICWLYHNDAGYRKLWDGGDPHRTGTTNASTKAPHAQPSNTPIDSDTPKRLKDLRSGNQILSWQIIGPFEYDSFDEAYDSAHVIEKEPIQLDKVYETNRWKAYDGVAPEIDVVRATSATLGADKVCAYYAVCWTNFGGQLEGASLSVGYKNCGYKSWINRHPFHGVPKIDSATTCSSGLFRGTPKKDWNEVLIKIIVDPKLIPNRRSAGHAFSFLVEGQKDAFGRPVSRSPMQYTNQPP
jgi:serine/threonine protein kinase